jgi:hypothetical protein
MKTIYLLQKLTYFFLALGVVFAGAGFLGLDSSQTKANEAKLGISVTGSPIDPGEAIIMITIFNTGSESGEVSQVKASLSPSLVFVPDTTTGLTNQSPTISSEGDWTALRWNSQLTIPTGNSELGFRVRAEGQVTEAKVIVTANTNQGVLPPATTSFTVQPREIVEVPRVEIPPVTPEVISAPTVIQAPRVEIQPRVEVQPRVDVTTEAPRVVERIEVERPQPPSPVAIQQQQQQQQGAAPVAQIQAQAQTVPAVSPQACAGDERITFEPPNPREGDSLVIRVSSNQPHVFVRLEVIGPREPITPTFIGVDTETRPQDPVWSWRIENIPAGRFTFRFFINNTVLCATAVLDVPPREAAVVPAAEVERPTLEREEIAVSRAVARADELAEAEAIAAVKEAEPVVEVTPPAAVVPSKTLLPITGGWNLKPFNLFAFFFSIASFLTAFFLHLKTKQKLLPSWQKGLNLGQKKWYYY